jgi:DNA helicase MCM8
LIDRPNEELDGLLSDHIMNLHKSKKSRREDANVSFSSSQSTLLGGSTTSLASAFSLLDRLRQAPHEQIQSVPADLLRKYIAYARRYVFPKITAAAGKVLQSFYIELRQKYQVRTCSS